MLQVGPAASRTRISFARVGRPRATERQNGRPCGRPCLNSGQTFLALDLRSCADCGWLGDRGRLVFTVGLLLLGLSAFTDVDAAFEEGAVFDGDAGGDDVAGEGAVAANVDAIAGGKVAADFAEHDDLTGVDVGGDYAIAADGDAVAGQIDGTFHPTVNVKRLGAGDFALNDERLANGGLVGGGGGDRPGGDGLSGHRGSAGHRRCGALRHGGLRRSLGLIGRLPHGVKVPFLVGIRGHWPHFRDQSRLYSRVSK